MKELVLRGAISMLLELFKTPHLLDPFKPALLKVFSTTWLAFYEDPDFLAVVEPGVLAITRLKK